MFIWHIFSHSKLTPVVLRLRMVLSFETYNQYKDTLTITFLTNNNYTLNSFSLTADQFITFKSIDKSVVYLLQQVGYVKFIVIMIYQFTYSLFITLSIKTKLFIRNVVGYFLISYKQIKCHVRNYIHQIKEKSSFGCTTYIPIQSKC